MYKKTFTVTWLLLSASFPLLADEKVDSGDPCTVVLCMYVFGPGSSYRPSSHSPIHGKMATEGYS